MDNDNWLSDIASSLGLDSTTSPDHPIATDPTQDLTHLQPDRHTTIAAPIDHTHSTEIHTQIHPEPHEWHQNIMWFHSPRTTLSEPTDAIADNNSSQADALSPHHHYDASQQSSIVIGNPTESMSHWHQQEAPMSCSLAAQQSAIEQITHQHFTEAQLRDDAQAHGWHHQNTGTPVEDFGKLLAHEAHVPVESHFGGTIAEIENKLAHHEQVFVGVNSQVEWLPDRESLLGQVAPDLFDPHHFAGQPANHIVQIVGVECDPQTLQSTHVIVNDSGSADGRGVEIPVEQFQVAMASSHNFVASTASQSEGTHLVEPHTNSEHMNFGCTVTTFCNEVKIDGIAVGTYNGNSFYWYSSGKRAGTWSCDSHYAYTSSGVNLGYAATWSDAALLIYKQS